MALGNEPVVFSRRLGGVTTIELNRPNAMNAITVELGAALEKALRGAGADPRSRVVVLRGAGGNFCAGGDFHEVERLRRLGSAGLAPLFENFGRACALIGELPCPVVAAVQGCAMAGGFELMQACDIALVHEDAAIADNHANVGLIPGGGSTQRLPRLVGAQRALGLILSGDRLTGEDAVRWGLAYRSFPAEDFEDGVAGFAAGIADHSPVALTAIKQLVLDGLDRSLAEGLALERRRVVDHIAGDAGRHGVTAFRSRSAP